MTDFQKEKFIQYVALNADAEGITLAHFTRLRKGTIMKLVQRGPKTCFVINLTGKTAFRVETRFLDFDIPQENPRKKKNIAQKEPCPV